LNKRIFFAKLLLTLVAVVGLNVVDRPNVNVCFAEQQYVSQETIKADGYGAMPIGIAASRAKIMARRAAIVDAQRNLVETIKGTAVDAETTVNNFMLTNDTITTKVSGIIVGAKVVEEEVTQDGLYHVIMSVPMYGAGSIADVVYNAVLPNNNVVAIAQPSRNFSATYVPSTVSYTGLVIDATGNEVDRTFCPAIYDTNGRTIYGVYNVDKSYAISHGIVEYVDNINNIDYAKSRAGDYPLIVKIVGMKTRIVNKCDVIISVEDADKILAENQKSKFLDKYLVVFKS
jgi:hypothetical protein